MRLTPPEPQGPAPSADASLIPLINVVFLMLIFFIVVGQITAPDALAVDPPMSHQGLAGERDLVELVLDREGRIALDGRVIALSDLGPRLAARLDERKRLGVSAASAPASTVSLKADAAIEVGRLRALMQQLRALGVARVQLAARQALR